jgi:glycosyltransferase involved in cell wall biosynthesis
MKIFPTISIVIPTLNSQKILKECLESIKNQDYPKEKIEIIIADGGSTDRTLDVVRNYTDKIFLNSLKTGEAGKAVGIKHATGEIIAFIDSDNILPSKDWLRRMVEPFQDEEITAAGPLYFTYRTQDDLITRYCALIGMNDPLCMYLGNYDRYCYITDKWTEVKTKHEDKGNYIKMQLNKGKTPTIGANGFFVRRKIVEKMNVGDYLFDIDFVHEVVKRGYDKFAKVKIGIVHIFAGNILTFIRKQKRRIASYHRYKKINLRTYPWFKFSKLNIFKFVFYTAFLFPLLIQVGQGFSRKKDISWLFHIIACWLILIIYGAWTMLNLKKD